MSSLVGRFGSRSAGYLVIRPKHARATIIAPSSGPERGARGPGVRAAAKGELQRELGDVRRAPLETSAESATFVLHGYRFLATGGPSVGSDPTELYDSISRLHAVGALTAAGFVPILVDES